MESRFTLKIKDGSLRQEFDLQRFNQTKYLSLSGVLFRIAHLLYTVACVIIRKEPYSGFQWAARGIQFIVFAGYLLLLWKWPMKFAKIQSVVLTPTYLLNLINLSPITPDLVVCGNLVGFLIFLFFTFMVNFQWIFTSLSMFLSTILLSIYFVVRFKFRDALFISLIIGFVILAIYACYFYEKILKESFLQIHQIKTMNEELKVIFDQLPEGVILFDPNSNKIALVNKEFKKLMDGNTPIQSPVKQNRENQAIELELLQTQMDSEYLLAPYFKLYYTDKQNKEQEIEDSQAWKQPKSLVEASEINDPTMRFKILKYDGISTDQALNESEENVISISKCQILYKNSYHTMIIIRNLKSLIQVENLRLENHFYEMLTATVSHDLRTPLNAIIGLLGNLDGFISDQRGIKFLNIIRNSSKFMVFLVNDLLDYYQIKNGKFQPNYQTINIQESIQELVDMFSIGAREKGISVIYSKYAHLPQFVSIDEQRTKQVILNLLQNSLKFTYHGSITVDLNYSYQTEQVIFTVQDTGVGIKPEDQAKLFQIFGKLECTASINTSGIGLGLSICKKIVESMNGSIEIDPSYQNGAKFIIKIEAPAQQSMNEITQYLITQDNSIQCMENDIPQLNIRLMYNSQNFDTYASKETFERTFNNIDNINESQMLYSLQISPRNEIFPSERQMMQQFDESNQSHGKTCKNHLKILVVDDNIFNLVTIQAILDMQFNIKSLKAGNGQEAIQIYLKQQNSEPYESQEDDQYCFCKNHPIKLIFMDCNMPILDGFQATLAIRELESQNQVREEDRCVIIALTAYESEMFKRKSLDYGMDNFITKPVNSEQIRQILQENNII
eukprot:403363702